MAATIVWDGYGRVSAVDSTTGVTALKISGTGGGPTAALADSAIQGSGAVTCTVNKQFVVLYYDIGAGNELDFSGGGTEENEFVHIWGQFLAPGGLATAANDGFGIFMESSTPSTTQYHCWTFGGSDTYDGSPIRMRLDPTKTASKSAGTGINTAAIRYFGVFADVGGNTLRFDNLILDAIDVGIGLRIYGTSTTDDLKADLLADEATNKYGIFLPLNESETAIELGGTIKLGDNSGTNAATLSDVDANIFVAEPLYYTTAFVAALPLTAFQILCVGNATGATDIDIGKIVGSGDDAQGRNGWSIVGNDTYDVSIDWDDGNVEENDWFGCSFTNLTGALSWGSDTSHSCIGNTFSGCEQFDPVGGVVIRACNFVSTANPAAVTNYAALLWNANIDIKNSNFINNTDAGANVAHDIEIDFSSGTAQEFIGLNTSGAEQQILYSPASGNITVNNSGGSNFSTVGADHTVTGTGTLTVNNNISVTLTGLKDNTEIRVMAAGSNTNELAGIENATTGTVDDRSFTFSLAAATSVDIYIVNKTHENEEIYAYSVPASDTSLPIQQRFDRNYLNP